MNEQSLSKINRQQVEVSEQPPIIEVQFIETLISKAVDSKMAVEVIKELRAMRYEDQQRAAEASFDRAMSLFQNECPAIIKTRGVKTNSGDLAYRYCPIEEIEAAIRPIERKHGFSHTFDQDTASKEGYVITKCVVTHVDPDPRIGSFTKTKTSMFPLGTKTQIMSMTQVHAAALTFANRRTLANAYGLVLVGEDNDAAGAKPKPVVNAAEPVTKLPPSVAEQHKEMKAELWVLLGRERRGTSQNWDLANQWLWKNEILDGGNTDEKMPDLSIEKLKTVIAKVKEKLKNV